MAMFFVKLAKIGVLDIRKVKLNIFPNIERQL
jgi:hypothetical protein